MCHKSSLFMQHDQLNYSQNVTYIATINLFIFKNQFNSKALSNLKRDYKKCQGLF